MTRMVQLFIGSRVSWLTPLPNSERLFPPFGRRLRSQVGCRACRASIALRMPSFGVMNEAFRD